MNRIQFYNNLDKFKKSQEKSDNELMHYGTPGQKWGVRKWQNYDGTFNEAGKERYFGKSSKSNANTAPEDKSAAVALAALWGAEMAVLIGGPLAAAAIQDAKVTNKIKKFEKNLATEETDPETGYKLKNEKMLKNSTKEDMSYVNMEHEYAGMKQKNRDAKEGTSMNCSLCTTAMVLRQKGYDVRAGKTKEGTTYQEQENRYKGGKFTLGTFKDIFKELESQPEGSYGHLSVEWREAYGGAHSMFYKIENGKPVVYCTQTNTIMKEKDLYRMASPLEDKTKYMRCDNLEVNWDYIKENKIVK